MTPAQKAAKTRQARLAFVKRYGTDSLLAARLICQDEWNKLDFAFGVASAAAYLANYNRNGLWRDMADACNF